MMKYPWIETYVPGRHWIIEAEFPDKRKVWGTAISINLKIDPGITPREWRAARDLTLRLLRQRAFRGRPSLSPEIEKMLQRAFETVGLPTENQTQADAVLAIVRYMSYHNRPLCISSVQKRYSLWLSGQGFRKTTLPKVEPGNPMIGRTTNARIIQSSFRSRGKSLTA